MDNELNRDYNNRQMFTSTAVEDNVQTNYETKNKETNSNINYEFETDDYSVNSNFKEETGYQMKNKVQSFGEHQEETFSFFKPIDIQRTNKIEEQEYSLTRTRQKLYLGGRMKIVISSFIVIMLSLMTAIVWNFAQLAKLNSSIAEKESQINDLENSIQSMSEEYKLVDSEEKTKKIAEASGYVNVSAENSETIALGKIHEEPKPTSIPSNWFNDVCNFLSHIFN